MDPYIKNNILHMPIVKGLDFVLEFDSPDFDLSQYAILRADFKASRSIEAPAFFSLSLGDGIIVTAPEEDETGNIIPSSLSLSISHDKTARIKFQTLYMDIKGQMADDSPVLLMSVVHNIIESTTNLQP